MKLLVVFLFVCVGYTLSYSDLARSIDGQWETYKAKYNKKYDGPDEHLRKAAFARSLQKIEDHNKSGKSWKIGLNEFSDMTIEETRIAFNVQASAQREVPDEYESDDIETNEDPIPASLDLRTDKCMPPIKNRGNCKLGDWAFAVVSAVEYSHCKTSNSLVVLSEQQVLDCAVHSKVSGCSKGNIDIAFNYLGSYGALSSSAYPYTAGSSGVAGVCNYCRVTESTKITAQPFHRKPANGEQEIMKQIVKNGLVASVGIFPTGETDSVLQYKSGVYDPSVEALESGTTKFFLNIVGWGKDSTTSKDYWILRNSLGAEWGQNGYFLLARNNEFVSVDSGSKYVFIKE